MLSTHWMRSICRCRSRSEYTMTILASDQSSAEYASYDRWDVVGQRCVTVKDLVLLHRVLETGVSEACSTSVG